MQWPIDKIINTANQLQRTGTSSASTGEVIAAAFVLNRLDYLPASYEDVVDAWERLGDWQRYVKIIKCEYGHLIEGL